MKAIAKRTPPVPRCATELPPCCPSCGAVLDASMPCPQRPEVLLGACTDCVLFFWIGEDGGPLTRVDGPPDFVRYQPSL